MLSTSKSLIENKDLQKMEKSTTLSDHSMKTREVRYKLSEHTPGILDENVTFLLLYLQELARTHVRSALQNLLPTKEG